MNSTSENDLKTFLKQHRPEAPEAPQRELTNLLAQINSETSDRRSIFASWWHIAIPVTVAACLTLFVVADFYRNSAPSRPAADNVELEVFLQETYAVIDNGNSDLTVGDDWLLLVR